MAAFALFLSHGQVSDRSSDMSMNSRSRIRFTTLFGMGQVCVGVAVLSPWQKASPLDLVVWKRSWGGVTRGAERWAFPPVLQGRAVLPYLWGIGWGKAYGYVASHKWCELHKACLAQFRTCSA